MPRTKERGDIVVPWWYRQFACFALIVMTVLSFGYGFFLGWVVYH